MFSWESFPSQVSIFLINATNYHDPDHSIHNYFFFFLFQLTFITIFSSLICAVIILIQILFNNYIFPIWGIWFFLNHFLVQTVQYYEKLFLISTIGLFVTLILQGLYDVTNENNQRENNQEALLMEKVSINFLFLGTSKKPFFVFPFFFLQLCFVAFLKLLQVFSFCFALVQKT